MGYKNLSVPMISTYKDSYHFPIKLLIKYHLNHTTFHDFDFFKIFNCIASLKE